MKGTFFTPDDLADRVFVAKEHIGGGLADHGDLGRGLHFLRAKDRALSNRPLAHIEILRRFAEQRWCTNSDCQP